jgi:methylmalonyl-CoA/ethylmalonyl-CoA epimerase
MSNPLNNSTNLNLAQIAWVVKDINATKKFFEGTLGVKNFSDVSTIRAKDYKGTYNGKPSNEETLVSMAYSGGTFIELIQPLSGEGVFKEYLNENPGGGVQHVAYRLPVSDLDKKISEFENNGYRIICSFDTYIAKIVFFDTRKDIGVFTEIMGITDEGQKIIEQMKSGNY